MHRTASTHTTRTAPEPLDTVDTVIIGAGVVGLAAARALARAGREVLILEAAPAFGTGTSSRNSEVLHAGLYYPPGSLKARLCVAGRRALVAYLTERGIAHRLCGKLVVATEAAEVPALEALHAQALANGVTEAVLLDGAQAQAMEPALRAEAALWSPVTGILDSHALMLSLLGEAQDHGAQLAVCSRVVGGERLSGTGWRLRVRVGEPVGEPTPDASTFTLHARQVVNAAGLHAAAVAAAIEGLPDTGWRPHRLCQGRYLSLAGRAPFSRLVYPVHNRAGLGVHLTLDLAGQARFGPDVHWLPAEAEPDAVDLAVPASLVPGFEAAIRRYWPALPPGALAPAYSGLRPKVVGPDDPAGDFVLRGPATHGAPGWVDLLGIESPGLTACLAVADAVEALLLA